MANSKKNKNDDYYARQKAMCKNLGIKPPQKDMGLIRRFKFVYRQLVNMADTVHSRRCCYMDRHADRKKQSI